jgi:hypothetical protein
MKQIVLIVVAIVTILVGFGFILPALAKLRAFGYLPGIDIAFLFLGILLAVAGPMTAFFGCRKRKM